MATIHLSHDGELYEVHYPPFAQDYWEMSLSATEFRTLLDGLWEARDYAQLQRLCDLFAWGGRSIRLDDGVIARLREDADSAPRVTVRRCFRPRIVASVIESPVDLIDLSEVPIPEDVAETPLSHFFECLFKDQDGAPIHGLQCRVEPPGRDPFIASTNELGLIRFDDLPSPGEYQVTPLPGAGKKGGRPSDDAEDWFECTLVGSQGEALADQACEVVTPDGIAHPCTSDADGLIRLEGLGVTGDCELRFLEAI